MLANAGIQVFSQLNNEDRLDSRVRGNDDEVPFHGMMFGAFW